MPLASAGVASVTPYRGARTTATKVLEPLERRGDRAGRSARSPCRTHRARVRGADRVRAGHDLSGGAHLRPAVGGAGETLGGEDGLLRPRARRRRAVGEAERGE